MRSRLELFHELDLAGAAPAEPPTDGIPERVPVARPRLPTTDRLVPYLRRIDDMRVYSNWGPLASELESRLAEELDLPPRSVASASSGTGALIGAILAAAGPPSDGRRLALIPA